jgi:hypothetical protein
MSFQIPANEAQRLAALRALDIVDSAPEITSTKSANWRRRFVGARWRM